MGRDKSTLLDIAKVARAILTCMQGLQKEQSPGDIKTQSTVLYHLIVIGKAGSGIALATAVERGVGI